MLAGTLLRFEKVTGMGLLGIVLVVGGMVLSNLERTELQRDNKDV